MDTVIHFKPGEKIIEEGEKGEGFFILQTGGLNVQKNGRVIAEIDEPGTIFGEMSDILDEPRTCTVIAKTDSYVIHILKNIDGIIDAYPSIAKKIIITLARRLEDTTKNLLVFREEEN